MTIRARYPGRCARCGGAIRPGDMIEWSRGRQTYHAECARIPGTPASEVRRQAGTTPVAGAPGGVRHTGSTNRRPGNCERCGHHLAAGEGRLEYCVEDSGCRRHHDHGGYHLYCRDSRACAGRRAEIVARRKAREEAAQRLQALPRDARLTTPPEGWREEMEYRRRPQSLSPYSSTVLGRDAQGRVWIATWNPGNDWQREYARLEAPAEEVLALARAAGWEEVRR